MIPSEKVSGCNVVGCNYCKTRFCWACHRLFEMYNSDVNPHRHKCHVAKPLINIEEYRDVPILEKQKAMDAFEDAMSLRKRRCKLLKSNVIMLELLYDCIFLLEWSHVVLMVCYSKEVKCNFMQAPLNTLKLCVNMVEHKLPHKKEMQNIEDLKSQCEARMRQVCTEITRLQKNLIQKDILREEEKEKREKIEKRGARKKRSNISQVDLLKETRK